MSHTSRLRLPRRGASNPATPGSRSRLRRTHGGLFAAGLAAAAVAASPAVASAAVPVTGGIYIAPTDLGAFDVVADVSGIQGARSTKLFEDDTVIDTEVDPIPGVGATPGIVNVPVTLTSTQLYGTEPVQFHLEVYDASGNELAASPVASAAPCTNASSGPVSPTNLTVDVLGSTTARLTWMPAQQDICHAKPTGFLVKAGSQSTVVSGSTTGIGTLTGLTPGQHYDATVSALPTSDVQPATPATVSFTTSTSTDTAPPTKPGTPVVTRTDEVAGADTITWAASTDDVGVVAYDVYLNGHLFTSTATTSVLRPGSQQGAGTPTTTVTVVARDAAGNASVPSDPATFNSCYVPGPPTTAAPVTSAAVSAVTSTTATITWTPGDSTNVCYQRPASDFVVWRDNGTGNAPTKLAQTTDGSQTSVTVGGLEPGTPYTLYVTPETYSGHFAAVVPTFTTPVADTTPPTKPGPPTVVRDTDQATNGYDVSWGASTDDVGVTAYDVLVNGTVVTTVDGTATSAKVFVAPNTSLESQAAVLTVVARDAAGNASTPSDPATFDSCHVPGLPTTYTAPSNPVASNVTTTSATITWTPGSTTTKCFVQPPSSYTVWQVDPSSGATTSLTTTAFGVLDHAALTGLKPATTYTIYVDGSGDFGSIAKSSQITFTTAAATPTTTSFGFGLTGAASLKNLVKGSVPLVGTVSGTLDTTSNAFTAGLQLAESTASLKALGFLPVTATVDIVPTGNVTGTLTGSVLAATVKTRIKLPSIKTFGIQLAGGANCQSAQVSTIPFNSVGAFSITSGGTLAGAFSISNLTGCGALNGIVSPLTSGNGNTIALTLKPGGPPAK